MARYARIEAGLVAAIEEIEVPDGLVLGTDIFAGLTFVPADDPAIGEGWSWDGSAFAPQSPPPVSPAALVAYAADVRWRLEVGGIMVGPVPVATDDRSKLMITGARVAAMADPGWSTVWHGADGQTYPVDAAAMVAISDAVQTHVNAGFATFAAIKAAIEAGTISTMAEIDAAFGSTPG